MSDANGSRDKFGASGLITAYLGRDLRLNAIYRRYRGELDPLSDRQLAKRYARYLRLADRMHSMYEDPSCWPARGLVAQATRRLYVAHRILLERGLHVPERDECWRRPSRSEIYHGNEKLADELEDLTREELEERLQEAEAQLAGDPWDGVLQQRQLLLWGALRARGRQEDAEGGGALMEVHPAQARVLRERVVREMSRQLGWPYTATESQQLLESVGIVTIEPPARQEAPWQS